MQRLEDSYLASDDPLHQCGFTGGSVRWRQEREPILEAIEDDGDLLDACCANGYLLECLVAWGRIRGREITPFGIDQGARLIALACARLPGLADHFQVTNAWDWCPPRRFRYVYALWDCVPEDYLHEFVGRLLVRTVAAGGRLILGAYGNRSRGEQPFDVGVYLRAAGYRVRGTACGGDPIVSRFAWIDLES